MRPYKTIHAALLSGECMESLLPRQDINYDLRDQQRKEILDCCSWVTSIPGRDATDLSSVFRCFIHSQKALKYDPLPEEYQGTKRRQTVSLENKVIRGKLTNCVIEETVMIGPDVVMEDCIVMNGTVIQGHATYKKCIFGVGC